jgi:PadR family transcriptional regulator
LGELERSVLVAIVHLQGQGYAVSIADETSRRLNKAVSLGAIYGTTDRLEKKGFISSRLGDPTPERGGKPKRLYRIEAPGELALSEVRQRDKRIWAGISPLGEPA